MKYVLSIVAFCSIFLAACKKEGDHLEGEYAVLVGTWEWYHTFGHGGTGNHGFYDLNPSSWGTTCTIEFKKEGRFKIFLDGELDQKGYVQHNSNGAFTLHGKDYEQFSSFLEMHSDTVILSNLPFDEIHIDNYFSRVD